MGGSLQFHLSFSTFHVDNKEIKINREAGVTHMIEENVDTDATCFLDTYINAFRVEPIIL